MMWFVSAILIFVSISLLKGNYSFVHGKVFDTTDNKKGYAKELGKPVLFVGIGILLYFSMVVYIDKSQFDNFISIHTKQLVLGLTAFFLPKF